MLELILLLYVILHHTSQASKLDEKVRLHFFLSCLHNINFFCLHSLENIVTSTKSERIVRICIYIHFRIYVFSWCFRRIETIHILICLVYRFKFPKISRESMLRCLIFYVEENIKRLKYLKRRRTFPSVSRILNRWIS